MFISDEVEPIFEREPALKKRTGVPDGFLWKGNTFRIVELLAEWHDYSKQREVSPTRRGQTQLDRQHGSWGLGRDYYRVRTQDGQVFELYYDRRPRRGAIGIWVLRRGVECPTT
jgi:hypothetical protein